MRTRTGTACCAALNRAGIDRSERIQALKRLVKSGEERVRARLRNVAAGEHSSAPDESKE